MIIQFSVGNFRSFSEIQTLNLVAAPLSSFGNLDSTNVFTLDGGLSLLRSAAIYGANAAGKSNLFEALLSLSFLAVSSFSKLEPDQPILVHPFLLNAQTLIAPSFFEVVFLAEGRRYRYGIEADQHAITAEWLYEQTSSRETKLFTRENQVISSSKAKFREGEKLERMVRPNASFLSVSAALEGPISRRIVRWFQNLALTSGLQDEKHIQYTLWCLLHGRDQSEIADFLGKLDVDLQDLSLQLPEGVGPFNKNSLDLAGTPSDESDHPEIKPNGRTVPIVVSIPTLMKDENGKVVGQAVLDLAQHASEGTKKLFAFAGPIVDTLKNGKVLFVDELDARLHPIMSSALVKLFNSPETNPKNAQLVFTTHDVNLLSNRIFRRDQIWFAEKNEQGATHLYSLAQFRLENGELARKNGSFETDYIQGKFGAIPFLGDLSAIFRQDEAEEVEKAYLAGAHPGEPHGEN